MFCPDPMSFAAMLRSYIPMKERGYEAILWLCGKDRVDNYKKLLNSNSKDKIKNELEVNVPEIYITNRYLSATEVRDYIIQNKKDEYKKSMPIGTDILYEEFRNEILKIQ